MEGPSLHTPDTTSLPATYGRLGDWGPRRPTEHSPARGVRGPPLPRTGQELCRPAGLAAPARGMRSFKGSAQPYLPVKGLRAWKEATFLASLLSSSERPLSVKPFERGAPDFTSYRPAGWGGAAALQGVRWSPRVPPHPQGRRHRGPALSPLCGVGGGAGRAWDVNLGPGPTPAPAEARR